MLIKKEDSGKKQNSPACTVWEYEFPTKNFGLATALVNGRYPENGKALNLECEEIYFVISGSGVIHSGKGDFSIKEGDAYFFEKNESYWVEGKDLRVSVINAPKWNFEQYKLVD